jgi:hypothetical protein
MALIRFYICGEHAAHAVTNYMELADIDLTINVTSPGPGMTKS